MRYVLLSLIVFTIACSVIASAFADQPNASNTPDAPLSNSVQLSRVVSRLPLDASAYKIEYGWFCSSGPDRGWPTGYLPASAEDLAEVFKRVLGAFQLNVVGVPDSVFDNGFNSRAELQIGATITKIESTLCFPHTGSPNLNTGAPGDVKGTMNMEIVWEAYSISQQKVVFKATTQAPFKASETMTSGVRGMVLSAFSANLSALAKEEGFQTLLRTRFAPQGPIEKPPSS